MVALGASLYAAYKSDKSGLNDIQKTSIKNISLQEITNKSFGTIIYKYNKSKQKDELVNDTLIKKVKSYHFR